jgi:hypothetical protein
MDGRRVSQSSQSSMPAQLAKTWTDWLVIHPDDSIHEFYRIHRLVIPSGIGISRAAPKVDQPESNHCHIHNGGDYVAVRRLNNRSGVFC